LYNRGFFIWVLDAWRNLQGFVSGFFCLKFKVQLCRTALGQKSSQYFLYLCEYKQTHKAMTTITVDKRTKAGKLLL